MMTCKHGINTEYCAYCNNVVSKTQEPKHDRYDLVKEMNLEPSRITFTANKGHCNRAINFDII